MKCVVCSSLCVFAFGIGLSSVTFANGTEQNPDNAEVVSGLQKLRVKLTTNKAGQVVEVRLNRSSDAPAALKELQRLPHLSGVWLGCPDIDDEDLRKIVHLRQLRELHIGSGKAGRCNVTDQGIQSLAALRQLKRFSLIHGEISEAGLAPLRAFNELEFLNLSGNRIHDAGLEHISNLTNLRELFLYDNNLITDKGLVHLEKLVNLQSLMIDGPVRGQGLAHLKGCEKLRTLDLTDSDVDDNGLKGLKDLRQLEWMSLSGTKVSDAGLTNLYGLTNLKTVWLVRTKATSEGIARLRKALPNTSVMWVPWNLSSQRK